MPSLYGSSRLLMRSRRRILQQLEIRPHDECIGEELSCLLPRVLKAHGRVASDGRPQPLAAPDDKPGLPVLADSQSKGRGRFIVVGAGLFEPLHRQLGEVQRAHFCSVFAPKPCRPGGERPELFYHLSF